MSGEPEKLAEGTLISHLLELRDRLLRALIVVGIAFVPCLLNANELFSFVAQPLLEKLPAGSNLIATGVMSPFTTPFKLSFFAALLIAMPYVLYQLWAFVAPGLTPSEKRALRPWIPLALFFFVLGVAIAWVILPFAIQFLLAFTDENLVATLAAPPYFDFVTTMFLVFGLLMEFPIVLYALARVGIISSARLRQSRRFIILGLAIFAAVATPGGDLVSPTVLFITMYILFELTVVAIRRSGR
jgi:sec-independent protein translocase protein TatC